MIVNTCPYVPSRNKNFILHTPWDKNFLLTQNSNFENKKFLPPFHIQLKFFCLWQMIVNTFPYHAPRYKNFIMHTPWDKNFLLSQNSNFTTKKFLPRLHSQIKFFCLLYMIAHSYYYHLSRNKIFILHTPWDKNFLLSQNTKFESKKFLVWLYCQIKLWNFGGW